jgi:hypothetical protein
MGPGNTDKLQKSEPPSNGGMLGNNQRGRRYSSGPICHIFLRPGTTDRAWPLL